MSNRLLVVLAVLGVCAVGLVKNFASLHQVIARVRRAGEFLQKFREFVTRLYGHGSFDRSLYEWLLKKSMPMQNELGTLGEMSYRPAFENYYVQQYEVLVNTIPEIGKRVAHEHMVASCDECVVRYIGFLEDVHAEVMRRLKNPFIWFRDGVRTLLLLPVSILKWFGLLPARWAVRISESGPVRILSGLVGLIGLFASVIQITTGWAPFVAWCRTVFR